MKNNFESEVWIWITVAASCIILGIVFSITYPQSTVVSTFVQMTASGISVVAVLYTIYRQDVSNREQNRLANMPVIDFDDVILGAEQRTVIMCITIKNGTFFVEEAHNYDYQEEPLALIRISVAREACAFKFRATNCTLNNRVLKDITSDKAYSLMLVPQKDYYIMLGFDLDADNKIESGIKKSIIVRFRFKDVFENEYFQDLYLRENVEGDALTIKKVEAPVLIGQENKQMETEEKK